jgi:hypothetical protein
MEHHEPMTTTCGRFARQCAELKTAHRGAYAFFMQAGGGPLDATDYIAAGGCDSITWKNGNGTISHQIEIGRGAA